MESMLLEAVRGLHVKSENGGERIDTHLHEHWPKKRRRPTIEESKKQLEDGFLTPPRAFSLEWLNRLQE